MQAVTLVFAEPVSQEQIAKTHFLVPLTMASDFVKMVRHVQIQVPTLTPQATLALAFQDTLEQTVKLSYRALQIPVSGLVSMVQPAQMMVLM